MIRPLSTLTGTTRAASALSAVTATTPVAPTTTTPIGGMTTRMRPDARDREAAR